MIQLTDLHQSRPRFALSGLSTFPGRPQQMSMRLWMVAGDSGRRTGCPGPPPLSVSRYCSPSGSRRKRRSALHLDTFAPDSRSRPLRVREAVNPLGGLSKRTFFDGGGGVPPQGRNINSSPSFKKTVLRIGRHFKRKRYGVCNVANPTNHRKPMPRRKRHGEDYFCAGGPGSLSRSATLPISHAKPKHGGGAYPKSVA